jgi:hypothetical protein
MNIDERESELERVVQCTLDLARIDVAVRGDRE